MGRLSRILLCTGLLQRAGAVLLVASKYPNHDVPLWGLPGGRVRGGERLRDALVREWREETGLEVEPAELLYVSESFDRRSVTHVMNATFSVACDGEPQAPRSDAHVVRIAWVPRERVAELVRVDVVRVPLVRHLAGDPRRYYAFDDAGITIRFADEP